MVGSPCIGICSTVYGDEVCRGCKRFYQEVIQWNTYEEEQKRIIHRRLEKNIVQVLTPYFEVTNSILLESRLKQHQIPYEPWLDSLTWVYALFCRRLDRIKDLEEYGIHSLSSLSLIPLWEIIETKLRALSQADFQIAQEERV